jgi:hypothetical protein
VNHDIFVIKILYQNLKLHTTSLRVSSYRSCYQKVTTRLYLQYTLRTKITIPEVLLSMQDFAAYARYDVPSTMLSDKTYKCILITENRDSTYHEKEPIKFFI